MQRSDLGKKTGTLDGEVINVACGVCIYEMDGDGCPIAGRIDQHDRFIYLADDAEFDTHGTGLCAAASNARVTGTVYEKGIVLDQITLVAP